MSNEIYTNFPILIIENEIRYIEKFKKTLKLCKFSQFFIKESTKEIRKCIEKENIQLLIMNIDIPGQNNMQILCTLKKHYPELCIIVVMAGLDPDIIKGCIQSGAFDFLQKPFSDYRLAMEVQKAYELKQLQNQICYLNLNHTPGKLKHPAMFSKIITRNDVMKNIFQYIENIAPGPNPVLITGESGTGKEEIARALHALSKRKGKLITINIAGMDDQMISDALFGHVTFVINLDCLDAVEAGTWDGTNFTSLNPGAGIPVIGKDNATGYFGVKFDLGFDPGETRHYYFTVNGNYIQEDITVVSKAGAGYAEGLLTGPSYDCDVTVPVNPPAAVDDAATTDEDTPAAIDVAANDSDVDGDLVPTSAVIISSPENGTVTENADGTITDNGSGTVIYTPDPDFTETDSFTYTISDGNGGSDTAAVTIEVEALNNGSIEIDIIYFTFDGQMINGQFKVTNVSDGYDVQITNLALELEYRVKKSGGWISVPVLNSGCLFDPADPFVVSDSQVVTFMTCQANGIVPAGATIRLIAKVQIYGRINGSNGHDGAWFLDRETMKYMGY